MKLVIIVLTLYFKSDVFGIENDLLRDFEIDEEDSFLKTPELIRKYGYPFQSHKVETSDGYILELNRIKNSGPPVFLMHGLLSSSAEWVLIGPNNSLAYLLADEGYDIWIGNSRGNRYSRAHTRLKPSDPEFWNFSWHEIGVYDLPASIDYILEETKFKKLQYIGHSQGTTSFFVLTSMRPEYNDKIQLMQALAPVAYVGNMSSPFLKVLALFMDQLWVIIYVNKITKRRYCITIKKLMNVPEGF